LAKGNVGLAFGLTMAEALVASLGSALPFLDLLFPHIPSLAHVKITESKAFLAGSLASSSGILLSFTLRDLFSESVASFDKSQLFDPKYSPIVASSIFVLTASLIIGSKMLVKKLRRFRKNTHGIHDSKEALNLNELVESEESGTETVDAKRFKSLSIQVAVALAVQ
jgi:hypothetical protein